MNLYKRIYKEIKKYDTIVLARHIGADPDALGSELGLKEIIKNKFPKKNVYAVGSPASKFKYIGSLDKFEEEMYNDSLLIVLDTPDRKRIDGVDPSRFKSSIKIDHHPFVDKTCDIEWIDDSSSSASQLVLELVYNTKLELTKEAAEMLYYGIVSDTNRFLYYYTTPKTFNLVSRLIKDTKIDFTKLYENMYLRPLKEVKFQSFISTNMTVTENGLAYMKITDDMLKEYNVDAATAGNLVTNFNYIDEIIVWVIFTEDLANSNIRASIRSRGPIINEVATHYNGGGHIYASGARLKTFEETDLLINELEGKIIKLEHCDNTVSDNSVGL